MPRLPPVDMSPQARLRARLRPGVIGTLGVRFAGDVTPSPFTTPEAPELQAQLASFRDDGCQAVAMEVSSHALELHRVERERDIFVGGLVGKKAKILKDRANSAAIFWDGRLFDPMNIG